MTTTDPDIIPEIAPVRLNPSNRDNNTSGPNAAPNPAHALPTRLSIVSFGVHAIIIDIIAIIRTDNRPTNKNSFYVFAASSPLINL